MVVRIARHDQIVARSRAGSRVVRLRVGAAPVRHDKTVKAPLAAKNVGEKVVPIRRVDMVELVVAGHNGVRLCGTHRDFKAS